jgi:hypothetical protein
LLLAQSTGAGALAVEDDGDDDDGEVPGEDGGCAPDGDADGDDGDRGADEDADRAESEDEDRGDTAGDREVEVAVIRCATRSVAEIGRQAVMNTPMTNIQRITLVITPG